MKYALFLLTLLFAGFASANSDTKQLHFEPNINLLSNDVAEKLSFDSLDVDVVDHRDPRDPDRRRQRVYCDYYRDSNTRGYSLYRYRDDQDLANAIWTDSQRHECRRSARVTNRMNARIACGRYHHSSSGNTHYSIYRVRDNQDLGKVVISNFEDCLESVRSSFRGIFCSTYNQNGTTWWSMYEIRSGQDIGRNLYRTLESCSADI